jgi:hypothetical protein
MILSPSWTTYRPQAMLAGHTAVLLTSDMESEWKVTPEILEHVSTRVVKKFVASLWRRHVTLTKLCTFILGPLGSWCTKFRVSALSRLATVSLQLPTLSGLCKFRISVDLWPCRKSIYLLNSLIRILSVLVQGLPFKMIWWENGLLNSE